MPPIRFHGRFRKTPSPKVPLGERRLFAFRLLLLVVFLAVVARLFVLQVVMHGFYAALAADQHSLMTKFTPERGSIYLSDSRSPDSLFPVAVNRPMTIVYANPREVTDAAAEGRALAPLLGLDEATVIGKLALPDAVYTVLKRRVGDDEVAAVKKLDLKGIHYAGESYRFYPEAATLSQITGFVNIGDNDERLGQYGLEGYWQKELAGEPGYLNAEKDPLGRLIGVADQDFEPAKNGEDLVLTVDRAIQYVVCRKLHEAVVNYAAEGGSVVILNPQTGAVIAMCNDPTFDANDYAGTKNLWLFNNPAVFAPYEPGSVFKPITMAAAIDAGVVTPNSTFDDVGKVVIGPYTIRNSDDKAHGVVTMTKVLEQSLNTGTVYVVGKLGREKFRDYVDAFGFGTKTGIDLSAEAAGDTSPLDKPGDIYAATASFGQGITTTPLQMAVAYAAIGNGGRLMKPYVVAERRDGDQVIKTEPTFVRQVVSRRAAMLVSSMLVSVVENGHGKRAAVPGYYVAGKTGTAQVPGVGGYQKDSSIGSFAGFVPVDNPAFAMVVELINPKNVEWAESSAAPLFGDISAYLLKYMEIPPERPIKK